MEPFWTQMERFIQEGPLCRRIILTPSRSMGRQLLIGCARRGQPVVGVEVHSIFTLAMELCSSAMTGENSWRFLSRLETEEQVARLLRGSRLAQHSALNTASGVKSVWRLLEELDLYQIPTKLKRKGQYQFWNGLMEVRKQLRQKCESEHLLTRPNLYRLALELIRQQAVSLPAQRYAMLSSVSLTSLEKELWQALTQQSGAELLTMPILDGNALATQLQGRCRFVRCRGVENEVRFILDEVLRRGKSPDTAAVAVPNPEYGFRLWQEGKRLGVPVAVDGGIPLRHSTLYGLLEGLHDWWESGYEVEKLIPLLRNTGLDVPFPVKLSQELRRWKVGWTKERYALVWRQREEDKAEMQERRRVWKAFFDRLFPAVEVWGEQKQALSQLLQEGCKVKSAENAAASWQLRSILEQLEPRDGVSVMQQLLQVVGDSRYLGGRPAPGTLYCASLEQCAAVSGDVLFIPGLGQYSLEPSQALSPLIGCEERKALGLPERQLSSPLEQLQRLLTVWEGEVVLLRPSFVVAEMREQAAAPLYEELLDLCNASEEAVDFTIPLPEQTADQQKQAAPSVPSQPAGGEVTAAKTEKPVDGKAWVEQYVFSSTSLETALQCPYRFYLQYVLGICQPDVVERREKRWLEAGPFGTLVHDVLELYFKPGQGGQTPDAEELLAQCVLQMKKTEPPASDALMQRDIERARQYIQRAIAQFDAGRTVVGTEYAFGKDGKDELLIPIGAYHLRVEGRIDRIDRLPSGGYAVVDYKTGQSRNYREHPDHYLQPLLYTLAAEKLLGEGAKVEQAGYLFLQEESDNEWMRSMDQVREDGLKRLEALLHEISQMDRDPMCNPCYEWDSSTNTLKPTTDPRKQNDHSKCGTYCPYKLLCEGAEGESS